MTVDWNEVETYSAIAAVCLNREWHFFYDDDFMFILDWMKYDGDDSFQSMDGEGYRPLIVDSSNAQQWMSTLAGELTIEQIEFGLENQKCVRLTFLINFDEKLWVGYLWKQDQSPLNTYQPDGWRAFAGNVYTYLPASLATVWDKEKLSGEIIVRIGETQHIIIPAGTRADIWGAIHTKVMKDDLYKQKLILAQQFSVSETSHVLEEIDFPPISNWTDKEITIAWHWLLNCTKKLSVSVYHYWGGYEGENNPSKKRLLFKLGLYHVE